MFQLPVSSQCRGMVLEYIWFQNIYIWQCLIVALQRQDGQQVVTLLDTKLALSVFDHGHIYSLCTVSESMNVSHHDMKLTGVISNIQIVAFCFWKTLPTRTKQNEPTSLWVRIYYYKFPTMNSDHSPYLSSPPNTGQALTANCRSRDKWLWPGNKTPPSNYRFIRAG